MSICQARNYPPLRNFVNYSNFSLTTMATTTKKQDPKLILIVDDDEDSRHFYREVFKKAGFSVLVAADGLEGLDVAMRERPDLIFTGIIMPRMDGFELIKNLRTNVGTTDIPVIMFSHLGREEDKRRAQDLGVRDFIVKSIVPPNEVVSRINLIVGGQTAYRLSFDPAGGDAARLARDFDFPPYFEGEGHERMELMLEPFGFDEKEPVFKAKFVKRR